MTEEARTGRREGYLALAVAATAVLVRLPALAGQWVWDDLLVVHVQLGAFRTLRDVFFPPAGIPNFSAHYYRPLTVASYLIDRALFGESPFGFHLTVLLAHAAAAALLFLLARKLLPAGRDSAFPALAGSLLFAVHPVLTESVCWIAGRADVLAAGALLASALTLLRRPLGNGAIAVGVLLFSAAALFKEAAFGFLPLAPVLAAWPVSGGGAELASTRDHAPASARGRHRAGAPRGAVPKTDGTPRRRAIAAGVGFGTAAVLLLALRWAALHGLGADRARGGGSLEMGRVLVRLGGALAFYLPRTVLPLPPAPYVDATPGGAAAAAGLAGGAALIVLAIVLMGRPASRTIGLGLALFFGLLAPSLVPAVMQVSRIPLAERYLYLPLAGLAVAGAGALALPRVRRRRAVLAAAVTVAALFAVLAFTRTGVWHDEIALWTTSARGSPSPDPRIFLATALVEHGRGEEAEAIYHVLLAEAGTLDDARRALVTMNLSVVLAERGRNAEALEGFEQVVRLDPASALGWYNLSKTLWEMALIDPATGSADRAKIERAREAAGRAARLSPLDARTQLLEGRIEGALGHAAEARAALTRASELDRSGELGAEARRILSQMK